LEKQANIPYRILAFIAYTNIFISVCAASVAAWAQFFFLGKISILMIWVTLGTTFILYNTQQLFLGYISLKDLASRKKWAEKNKILLQLVFLVGIAELYPLYKSSWQFLFIYVVAGLISLLYFLPFFNLRSVPFLKSFIIGMVWVLVCVGAPLNISEVSPLLMWFCIAQLFFITALCVLFNIRDLEQDKISGAYTVPVLYGTRIAKIFTLVLLAGYLLASYLAEPGLKFMAVSLGTFLLSCFFTIRSFPKNHPFYYLFGVDGIILLQSVLGIVILLK